MSTYQSKYFLEELISSPLKTFLSVNLRSLVKVLGCFHAPRPSNKQKLYVQLRAVFVKVFGNMKFDPYSALNRHNNFQTFFGALLLLFRWVVTGDRGLGSIRCVNTRTTCCVSLSLARSDALYVIVLGPRISSLRYWYPSTRSLARCCCGVS